MADVNSCWDSTRKARMEALRKEVATRVARKIFEVRGNHSEAHLGENELVVIVESAIDLYQSRVSR